MLNSPRAGTSKEFLIGLAEEVEALVASVILLDRLGDFNKLLRSVAGIVKCGDKFKITAVCAFEKLGQDIQTVDVLFHRGNLALPTPVIALDFSIVPELGDIVGGCFNPQDDPELVVHLNGDRTHMVLDSRAKNACVEVVAHFALVVSMEFLPQEGGDVLRFDGVDGCAHQRFIERPKISLPLKTISACVFCLHDAPSID